MPPVKKSVDVTRHHTVSGILYIKVWEGETELARCYAYHTGCAQPQLAWTVNPYDLPKGTRDFAKRCVLTWYRSEFNAEAKNKSLHAGKLTSGHGDAGISDKFSINVHGQNFHRTY